MIKFELVGYGYGTQRCEKPAKSIAGAQVLSVCDKNSAARRRIHREAALQQFANCRFTGLGMWTARYGVLTKLGITQTSSIHSEWVEILVGPGYIAPDSNEVSTQIFEHNIATLLVCNP